MLRAQPVSRSLIHFFREELLYKTSFAFVSQPGGDSKKGSGNFPKKVKNAIRHMVDFVKEGSKKSWEDMKYFRSLRREKTLKEYTAVEYLEYLRIRQDMLKLIPFSIMIIVPLMDLLIPFYVLLFPNGMPTAFHSRSQIFQKRATKQEKQSEAYEILLKTFLEKLKIQTDEPDVLKILWRERREDIEEIMDIRKMDSDTLLALNRFVMNDYIGGTHIASELMKYTLNMPRYLINLGYLLTGSKKRLIWRHWIFNYEIKLNFFPLEPFKALALRLQLLSKIKKMRKVDKALFRYGIRAEDPFEIILKIARSRGVGQSYDRENCKILVGDWGQKFGNDKQLTPTSYVWYAVINYTPE